MQIKNKSASDHRVITQMLHLAPVHCVCMTAYYGTVIYVNRDIRSTKRLLCHGHTYNIAI